VGLKVAMISPWHVKCGIATYTEHLAKALAELGVEVFICRWPRFGRRTPELIQSMVLDKIPLDKVDLIHCQHEYGLFSPNLEGGFYASLSRLGKPALTTMHATGNFVVDEVVAQVSKRVIVHNEFMARRFKGNSVIIPHGASPTECSPKEECKRSLGIDPRAPIVGYCGFISRYKGLETPIEALTKIPSVALLIAGGWHAGPDTQYIMELKKRSLSLLPGRCQWLGWVPDERLPTVYGAMDVVVYSWLYLMVRLS